MKQKHIFSFLAIAFFTISFISGCSSTSNPPATNPNTTPKKGSTYLFTFYQTDSVGNKVGPTTGDTATVIADGESKLGQSNVFTVLDGKDTAFYTYSGNFDLEAYIENSGLPQIIDSVGNIVFRRWITIPITSHSSGTVVLDSMNVSVNVPGVPFAIGAKVHVVTDYIGADSVKLVSETVAVQHCRITVTVTSASSLISPPVTLTYKRDIYFAPKLGYNAKVTTLMDIPTALGMQGGKSGSVQTLVSYNVIK